MIQARDLPVMERNMQGDLYTDAYVDIRFGDSSSRTQVKHKTLAPEWNEPFRFDVFDNDDLQSEPLEFRVMDHDVYTSDDSVGIVHVDLSPLLMRISESDDFTDFDDGVSGSVGGGGGGGGIGGGGGGGGGVRRGARRGDNPRLVSHLRHAEGGARGALRGDQAALMATSTRPKLRTRA